MRRIKRIFEILKEGWTVLSLIPKENKSNKLFQWFDVMWCLLKYGAMPEDYISLEFFKKGKTERPHYVTQRNKQLFYQKMYDDEARKTLDSKNLFSKRFSPKYVTRDWLFTGDSTEQQIRDFFSRHEQLIVKPVTSTWGIGVKKIEGGGSELSHLLIDVKSGVHYMIEEIIVNHPDVARVNPDSVNTLRVETCLDANGGFHLLNVLFMVGTTKTVVSNCHSGGMMCHVDVKTGCIDNAGFNPTGKWYEVHPVSGIKLRGYKLPYIDKLEEYIKGVCQVMPNARYVGWDVVITPSGFELIEGNYCPGQCTQTCDGVPKYDMLKAWI